MQFICSNHSKPKFVTAPANEAGTLVVVCRQCRRVMSTAGPGTARRKLRRLVAIRHALAA